MLLLMEEILHHLCVARSSAEAFGQAEGDRLVLVDVKGKPGKPQMRGRSSKSAFEAVTPTKITAKIHGPPARGAPWETPVRHVPQSRATLMSKECS